MRMRIGFDTDGGDGRPVYAAMGNFDGVHRGHRALLGRLVDEAHHDGASTMVITFSPHPLAVLRPTAVPPLLTTIADRAYLMSRLGIDILQVIPFDQQFAAMTAEDFIRRVLVGRFGVACLFGGARFAFGRHRQGNAELIRRLAPVTGCQVKVVEPVPWAGKSVSSTVIRRLVADGQVAAAADLLTQPLIMMGRVVQGPGRGRRLGFPTANLELPADRVQPAPGVYAVSVCAHGRVVAGVANLGTRPTFTAAGSPVVPEIHLLDWQGDLYGTEIRVAFIERLRAERQFPDVAALVRQIQDDVAAARAILAAAEPVAADYLCLAPQN